MRRGTRDFVRAAECARGDKIFNSDVIVYASLRLEPADGGERKNYERSGFARFNRAAISRDNILWRPRRCSRSNKASAIVTGIFRTADKSAIRPDAAETRSESKARMETFFFSMVERAGCDP